MIIALLISHITIALSSIVATTLLFFAPSTAKLHGSYALVAATIGSGTVLVIAAHARLASACLSGLLYLGVVSIGIVHAHYKLATAKQSRRR